MIGRDELAYWNDRYRGVGENYLFGTEPHPFLARQATLLAPEMRALSLGDGEGRNSVWLASQGLTVTALELSPVALAKARRLAEERGARVDFVLCDMLKAEWPGETYDVVVGILIQVALPEERLALFSRIKEHLRPGGLLLLHGYTPKQLEYKTGGPDSVDYLYTADMLREAFADFEILELREYETVIEASSKDPKRPAGGRSAVVDLVARKRR